MFMHYGMKKLKIMYNFFNYILVVGKQNTLKHSKECVNNSFIGHNEISNTSALCISRKIIIFVYN